MASRSRWCAWILSLVAMDSWLMSRLLRSLHLRIGEAAPDQPAEVDHHLASLSGRQIRPVHLSRPRLHRHGAAPATGPPPARRHGPPLDRGSTVLALQRFLRWLFEPSFRDTKDLRFGLGLSSVRISDPQRRDRLLLLNAF